MADDIYRDEKKIREKQEFIVNSLTTSYSAPSGSVRAVVDEAGNPAISFTNIPTHSIEKYLQRLDQETGCEWRYYKNEKGKPCLGTITEGKYLEIPLEGHIDRTKEMQFNDVFDFQWALENCQDEPGLLVGRTQVAPGNGNCDWRIEVPCDLSRLKFPNATIVTDGSSGRIELPNQRAIDLVSVNEHEKSLNAIKTIESTTRKAAGSDALQDHKEDNANEFDNILETMEDMSVRPEVDFDRDQILKALQQNYSLDNRGCLVGNRKDGDSREINVRRVENSRVECLLKVNKLWCMACCGVMDVKDDAGTQMEQACMAPDSSAGEAFDIFSKGFKAGYSLSQILNQVAQSEKIQDSAKAAEIILSFAESLIRVGVADIKFEKSKDKYIEDVNEAENELYAGMGRLGPGMTGYNPNNTGTQN